MDEKDLERTQCVGVIGSVLIAALVAALAMGSTPGTAQPQTPAAPVAATPAAR